MQLIARVGRPCNLHFSEKRTDFGCPVLILELSGHAQTHSLSRLAGIEADTSNRDLYDPA